MLIIKVGNDGIEKALKKYRSKYNKTKVAKKVRQNSAFEKPSEKRRAVLLKAEYVQKKFGNEE
jgi:small subunit ribosomal protein S21